MNRLRLRLRLAASQTVACPPAVASSRTVAGPIALAAVIALSLAGCSADDESAPRASSGTRSSSSSSAASSGALKDESEAVLSWRLPAPVARTEGKLAAREGQEKSPTVPATAEIISIQASDVSTILTWQLSSATEIPSQGFTLSSVRGVRDFPDLVLLVDPVGKSSYSVNTMTANDTTYCVCSAFPRHVGPDPVRMTAEYPPLPASVTSVSVRIPNFARVKVAVTR